MNRLFQPMTMVCVVATLSSTALAAADFNPPSWSRSDPFATTASWDFDSPPIDTNSNGFLGDEPWLPDGNVPFKGGNSGVTTQLTFAPEGGPSGNISWDGVSGLETIDDGGDTIVITVDNILDDRPFKLIRIQIAGSSTSVDPVFGDLTQVNGFDATDGPVTDFQDFDSISTTFIDNTNDFQFTQDIRLEPNPDSEVIFIEIGLATTIDELTIDTISLPEPTTALMCGLGGLALLRRRQAAGRASR